MNTFRRCMRAALLGGFLLTSGCGTLRMFMCMCAPHEAWLLPAFEGVVLDGDVPQAGMDILASTEFREDCMAGQGRLARTDASGRFSLPASSGTRYVTMGDPGLAVSVCMRASAQSPLVLLYRAAGIGVVPAGYRLNCNLDGSRVSDMASKTRFTLCDAIEHNEPPPANGLR